MFYSIYLIELHPDDRIILRVLNGAIHLDGSSDIRHNFRLSDEGDRRTSIQPETNIFEKKN